MNNNVSGFSGYKLKVDVRHLIIYMLTTLMALPLVGFSYGEVAMPIAWLVALYGFVVALVKFRVEMLYLLGAILFSVVAVLSNSTFVTGELSIHPFLSVFYFFFPVFGYFAGRYLVNNDFNFYLFLKAYTNIFLFFIFIFSLSVFIFFGGMVRTEGEINGWFFWLPIYGLYGVHSFVAFLFVSYYIIVHFYRTFSGVSLLRFRLFIFVFLWLTIFSLSREGVLGLVVVFMFMGKDILKRNPIVFVMGSISALLLMSVLAYLGWSSLEGVWSTRIDGMASAIERGDLDELSSGRLTLYFLAVEQFLKNPLFGNGFYGFQLYNQSFGEYTDLTGWSPHNYLLTSIWKMGVLPLIFFAGFWICIIKSVFKRVSNDERRLVFRMLIVLGLLNMFWDAFLVPNVMILFSFFLGALNRKRDMGHGV